MKLGIKIALTAFGAFALMQVVRFEHTNPPVRGEIDAPPEVKALLKRACYDCHSNETVWLWYSNIAPASWLIHRDVVEGRRHLNFSEWTSLAEDRRARKQRGIGKQVKEGEMPPWFYLPMHSTARLSPSEVEVLQTWAALAPAPAKDDRGRH